MFGGNGFGRNAAFWVLLSDVGIAGVQRNLVLEALRGAQHSVIPFRRTRRKLTWDRC